jgi:hypothetical protein
MHERDRVQLDEASSPPVLCYLIAVIPFAEATGHSIAGIRSYRLLIPSYRLLPL